MSKIFFLSGFFSFFWSGIFLILGRVLDKLMPHYLSTILASLSTATGNFFMQYYLFSKDKMTVHHAFKYGVVAVIETFGIAFIAHEIIVRRKTIDKKLQRWVKGFKEEWNKYFNTIARIIAGLLCFILISYPFRKLWVFKH